MDISRKKQSVIDLGKALAAHELIARTWGNVSVRLDDERFLITPSGRTYESLTPDDIVEVKMEDLSYEGSIKPSSEKGIHASVYQMKPHINCVIHTHQKYASALSATGLKELDLDDLVPCAAYGLPGTKTLNQNVNVALGVAESSVVMKFHGALCFGKDDKETLQIAIDLEKSCKAYIHAYLDKSAHPVDNAIMALGGHPLNKHYDVVSGNWLQTPSLLAISEMEHDLVPLLDDFAQLTGIKAPCVKHISDIKDHPVTLVKGKGAFLQGTEDEIETLRIVTDKAAEAYVTAHLFGKVKPIPFFERLLMRLVFKYKYSKKAKEA